MSQLAVLLLILTVLVVDLFVLTRWARKLEKRVAQLEEFAHPPVDVRPAMRMVARAEVKRFLEEHVP